MIQRWQAAMSGYFPDGTPSFLPPMGGVSPVPCETCSVSRWIELGGGPANDCNRPNIDIAPGDGVDIVCNLETESLPFHDDHATYVKSIHSLQHLSRDGARHVIKEAYRILEPGGKFYIMVGDLNFICQRVLEDGPYEGWLACLFHGPETTPAFGHHKWSYTWESIRKELTSVGFSSVEFKGRYNYWEIQLEAIK